MASENLLHETPLANGIGARARFAVADSIENNTTSGGASETTEGSAPPLQCDICGATKGRRGNAFRNQRDLKTHRANAHRHLATRNPIDNVAPKLASAQQPQSRVHFCPNCGCNLEVVNAALSFLESENRP